MAEYISLTRADVPGHDDQAKDLIVEMVALGWTGRLSSKGHAIMRSPDGESTSSIARDSKRGRSGRNARADFERWKSAHLEEPKPVENVFEVFDQLRCKVCGETFKNARALGAHRNKHYPAVTCEICGKQVKYVARHMRTHEEERRQQIQEMPLSQRLLQLASEVEELEQKLQEGETS